MAKLLADENFPLPTTEELRLLGHDVLTLEELGKADQGLTDPAVLSLATEQGRAVLTINRRHFVRLHEVSQKHPELIVCSLDINFAGQAERISEAIGAEEPLASKLLRINRPG